MRKLMVLFVLLGALVGCGNSASGNSTAQSLNGSWRGDDFNAVITNNHVKIIISDGTVSGLYWDGTFPTGSDTVKSIANRKALDASFLASQSQTKEFTVKHGKISFQFTILGTTRTVEMKRI